MNSQTLNEQLLATVSATATDPLGFCQAAFPWARPELDDSLGPRQWQAAVLEFIGERLRNPETRCEPIQVAVSSGHGVGKSALVGMVTNWAMSSCPDCRVVLTAATEGQLRTKLWPEVSKWFNLSITKSWFSLGATTIASVQKDHERVWRADALPWSEFNSQAFAGLHNKGKRILMVFDEASTIHDRIWETVEGTLTDANTEIIWLVFGNPEQPAGRFRECFGKFKHRWHRLHLDSRTVEGTNLSQLDKWVEDYGLDSDFCRIRVKGEFPRVGSNCFIPQDAVERCRQYTAVGFETQPRILGVDVARFGQDQTVLCLRQGRKVFPLEKYRGWSIDKTADYVFDFIQREHIDATVVDSAGLGAGVFDNLNRMGVSHLYEHNGGTKPFDAMRYYNRRAEVWGLMREAVIANLDLPGDDVELADDLVGPTFGLSALQQIQLEKKDDMRRRGLNSPDCGDALSQTFAVKLAGGTRYKTEVRYVTLGLADQNWMA